MSGYDDRTVMIGNSSNRTRPTAVKGASLNAAQRAGADLMTTKTTAGQSHGPADHGKIAALDRNNEPKPPALVGSNVSNAVKDGRMKKMKPDGKCMTQKDLATACNVKPQDIADLEAGRAPPNQQLLAKIERILGIKLRGAPSLIGTPLGGPKKK